MKRHSGLRVGADGDLRRGFGLLGKFRGGACGAHGRRRGATIVVLVATKLTTDWFEPSRK